MSSRRPRALLAAAAASLALAACGTSEQPPAAVTATPSKAGTQRADSFSRIPAIVRAVQPEVVTVLTGEGVGSGVIYRSDGVILTNEHVVGANQTVQVAFADGRREPGEVQASDGDTDLAIVKVNRRGLPAATFQAKLPAVGALAVVLGSPLGFEKSVTAGIVSGLHREIPGSAAQSAALVDLVQTDAPISPGNSGGAVVDGRGHVIGIAEAYIPPAQGAVAIGFAIPTATAIDVAEQLLKHGRVEHAFLGIQPAQLTPQLAQRLEVRTSSGVVVYAVTSGGPADQAHIKPGDVLVRLAGKPVPTVEELYAVLREHRPGQTVPIELARSDQHETADVTLSAKSE
ncbi:MAG: S1C family serine protease [Solirubrobacteraceae bacterium]